ncbi:MAG: thiamine pyrophosphate-dependent dehydrogenase E1 component subunit alpha [Acidobacteriia bacterium]|nr:thiamine pyrophosphate-dependent dehydrogenase E1 component subunit alpha [Terriglobia bacterium]
MNKVEILKRMVRIRMVELYIARRYPEQKMRCPTHLCLGQEAAPAVCGYFAGGDDIFVGTCRSHGHYLAKGGNLTALFAELLGSGKGCSKGLGGSMHLIDLGVNFWGTSAIVGGGIPIAAGAAFRLRYENAPQIVVVFLGDAAVEEGVVYETVNFALLHKLPLVFVCENNALAITTPIELRQCSTILHDRFQTMGMNSFYVAENDISQLIEAIRVSYARARTGLGPTFIEYRVSRWCAHVGPAFEGPVDLWWQPPAASGGGHGCPICVLRDELIAGGAIRLEYIRSLRQQVQQEIEEAYRQAESTAGPIGQDPAAFVYASGLACELPSRGPVRGIEFRHAEASKLVNAF